MVLHHSRPGHDAYVLAQRRRVDGKISGERSMRGRGKGTTVSSADVGLAETTCPLNRARRSRVQVTPYLKTIGVKTGVDPFEETFPWIVLFSRELEDRRPSAFSESGRWRGRDIGPFDQTTLPTRPLRKGRLWSARG